MSAGFLRGKRRYRRTSASARRRRTVLTVLLRCYPAVLTLLIGLSLSAFIVGQLEERLRPVLLTASRIQIQNEVTALVEQAVTQEIEVTYSDLVAIERGQNGNITAIAADMTAMNRLRSRVVELLLPGMTQLSQTDILIPLGSLIDSEIMWGRGPTVRVKTFTAGTVSAEFKSEFTSAGVNQTLHKIWLEVSAPVTILLPGTQTEVAVDTRLCVAETVIVGQVPSYVQKAYGT